MTIGDIKLIEKRGGRSGDIGHIRGGSRTAPTSARIADRQLQPMGRVGHAGLGRRPDARRRG